MYDAHFVPHDEDEEDSPDGSPPFDDDLLVFVLFSPPLLLDPTALRDFDRSDAANEFSGDGPVDCPELCCDDTLEDGRFFFLRAFLPAEDPLDAVLLDPPIRL